MPLKYLFIARFADGHEIRQDAADVSVNDPLRSQFTDVCSYEETSPLVTFSLIGEGGTYSVNLENGLFSVNGRSFSMHGEDLPSFRVIFYRQHTHNFNVGAEKDEELSHEVVYCIGWQSTLAGKNYQQIMRIN